MTDTIDWATQLRYIVGSPLYGQRPFVCDGYPTESQVLIIGMNPATPLNMDWWDWWNSERGFDYDLFMSRYINTRRRTRKSLLGTTRRRFIRITDTLQSKFRLNLKSIETNVYRREARSEEQLRQYNERDRYPNDDVLHLLISGLQPPRVVIPHGDCATAWLIEQEAKLPPNIKIPNRVLPHLSKATDADITHICDWIRSLYHFYKMEVH